ncbi:MAG: hypothetical protein V4773_27675 [Verrucomicrobiota bacterium]
MKPRSVSAIKRALSELMDHAVMLKLFLPSRRDRYVDIPCLTDGVRGLRDEVSAIEKMLDIEFPRKPGEDVLWRHFEFEVPPDEHPVLVSIRAHPEAVCARWCDARWYYLNGVELHGEVYAWTPLPAACYVQRQRLMLMERRAS